MAYIALLGIIIFVSMFVNGYQLIKHNDIKGQIELLEKEVKKLNKGKNK